MTHVMAIAALLAAILQAPPARTPLSQSISLEVPWAPVTVMQDGRAQLVYELHLTNFTQSEIALSSVRSQSQRGTELARYQDVELDRHLTRPGLRNDHATPRVIAAGMRAVVNFWIDLPAGTAMPASVSHYVEIDVRSSGGAATIAVGDAPTPVATSAPPILGAPLAGGPWVAIHDPLLKGGHRTAFYTVDGRARIPGRFAIDLVALPPSGIITTNPQPRPADWNGFGRAVLAVADGRIAAAIDDMPDDSPGPLTPEKGSGNYVVLDLGNGRFAFYEHLRSGSVKVKAGQSVKRGEAIAQLGSSGSTSIGPHLHFHVADAASTLGAEGMPFVFERFTQLGGFASIAAVTGGGQWAPAPAESRHVNERPAPNVVITF